MSNAVGGIFDTVGSIFGIKGAGGIFHGADYSGYNEMVAQYDNLSDIWDEPLDKKKAYINESYGAEASKAGEESSEYCKKRAGCTKETCRGTPECRQAVSEVTAVATGCGKAPTNGKDRTGVMSLGRYP